MASSAWPLHTHIWYTAALLSRRSDCQKQTNEMNQQGMLMVDAFEQANHH